MQPGLAENLGAGRPDSPLSAANYTFTDTELQSLLTSLDQGTGCSLADELMGGPTGAPHSLQFLPHLPSGHASPEAAPAVFVPVNGMSSDVSRIRALEGLAMPVLTLGPHSSSDETQQAAEQHLQEQEQSRHARHARLATVHRHPRTNGHQRSGAAAAMAAAAAREAMAAPGGISKQPHSLVEKQRRDRINHLIDELRDLVPPQGTELPPALAADPSVLSSDHRRPKHVVLSDTIRLIKDLQLQVAVQPQQAQHAPLLGRLSPQQPQHAAVAPPRVDVPLPMQHSATLGQGPLAQEPSLDTPWHQQLLLDAEVAPPPGPQQAQQDQAMHQEAEPQQEKAKGHLQLPHAPDGDSLANGVEVEAAEGNFRVVKVTCPDRHGLLADVVRALRELPLEITTAAITTRRDRVVHDVFQVELEDPSLPPQAICAAVESALRLQCDKKRRQASPGRA